ncbi:MAG: hypothetical protein IT209_09310 [Armatimonadetes bacterium]|nr:hypothetical protein [Armatimonadota bacterium]
MTPRQRLIAALRFEPGEGCVPHIGMDFRLPEIVYGEQPLCTADYEALPRHLRRHSLARNADLWIRIARRFGMCAITGTQWLPVEAQLESFQFIRELADETFMVGAFVEDMQQLTTPGRLSAFAQRIADDETALVAELDASCTQSIENIRELVEGGAEIILMSTMNLSSDGLHLSRQDFQRFVQPYIKRQVDAVHEAGAYALKRVSGNAAPVADLFSECGLDALHVLDRETVSDVKATCARANKRLCLVTNVEAAVLKRADSGEIQDAVRSCLDTGPTDGTGYVFSSYGCLEQPVQLSSYLKMLDVKASWEQERLKSGNNQTVTLQ